MKRCWLAILLGVCAAAHANVTRIVIDRVEAPAFDGREFGAVGRYEKLSGRAFGEIDPAHPLNAGITYIRDAPRNARGRVEYVVDIAIMQPMTTTRGNGTLLYDVVNRGTRRAFDVFHVGAEPGNNPTRAADAGDGFLLRQGYTLVVSGWQGDLIREGDEFVADFPVATRPEGPIYKTISVELAVTRPAYTLNIGWDNGRVMRALPPVERAMDKARLVRRAFPDAQDEEIPRDQWSFASCPDGKNPTPSNLDVCLPAGFSPDALYYLVYQARDPLVMGLAFAAVRDVVSFLRYDTSNANPLVSHAGHDPQPNTIRRALAFGRSQSGRFVRDFIYQGFNQDEGKRMVFDGAIALTAGARMTSVNAEFAMPGRVSEALIDHYAAGDQFPFTYETLTDPVSGRTDGLLARCREQGACPKIMQWDSGTEPWNGRASLVRTDPLGKADVPVPDNVRLYYFAGTQHVPAQSARETRLCQNFSNPNSYREAARALLMAMQDWITKDKPPPASRYPSLAERALVKPLPQREFGFPAIPGKRYTGEVNHLYMIDESAQPPRHLTDKQYTVLVPRVDHDGNDVAGIRSVTLQVPFGTYTGWNLRRKGYMEDRNCGLQGSYFPFTRWRDERGADLRPSLEERYASNAVYARQFEAAAQRLQQEGFLLPEDAARLVREVRERDQGL